MKNIFKSINKRSICQYCDGKIIDPDDEVCEYCNATGYTAKKMFVYYGDYFFEAERINTHGPYRKHSKWSVEVNFVETMTQEMYDHEIKNGGYPMTHVGGKIVTHMYKQDAWGKSIMVAYKKAFKNLQKYLNENKDLNNHQEKSTSLPDNQENT